MATKHGIAGVSTTKVTHIVALKWYWVSQSGPAPLKPPLKLRVLHCAAPAVLHTLLLCCRTLHNMVRAWATQQQLITSLHSAANWLRCHYDAS